MFVATGTPTPFTLTNNGFFPGINSDDFVKTQKLDGIVSDDRLVFALTLAISDANFALVDWQIRQEAMGYFELENVPSSQINNESRLVMLYKQAVFSFAKAHLLEKYRDFDTTALGNKKAENLEPNIDVYWRNARWALSDIQGKSRSMVELI
ncbi:MAG: head completion/stabilization protein [Moraxellaceae bacterium]|nr:head completion/stabilization protein [Moraxellaceae bacterium]